MPFLWAMNARECLEGIIDLAIFDPATERWLILDWKTNSQNRGRASASFASTTSRSSAPTGRRSRRWSAEASARAFTPPRRRAGCRTRRTRSRQLGVHWSAIRRRSRAPSRSRDPGPCFAAKICCRSAESAPYTGPASGKFLSSSAVEQSTVNRSVVGSIPTSGAILKVPVALVFTPRRERAGASTA